MDVRLARPTDAPVALALALDESAHLVKSFDWPAKNQVLRTLVRSALPMALPGRMWIARQGSSSALLEAVPRRYVIGWDVIRLSVHGDSRAVLPPVLGAAVDHLRSRGVPRLFARCSEAASEELKTVAFHPLAREYLLVGPEASTGHDEPLPVDSRYRMPQDAWPLHQLESETTPPLIRQMEGLTSLDWSNALPQMAEIVVERDGRVVCWIGWGARVGQNLHQIGLLVHPDYSGIAPNLLSHVIERSAGVRFLARVRDYQHDAVQTFLDAGFEITGEEILMVKHGRVEAARTAVRRMRVGQMPTTHIAHQRWKKTIRPGDSPPSAS